MERQERKEGLNQRTLQPWRSLRLCERHNFNVRNGLTEIRTSKRCWMRLKKTFDAVAFMRSPLFSDRLLLVFPLGFAHNILRKLSRPDTRQMSWSPRRTALDIARRQFDMRGVTVRARRMIGGLLMRKAPLRRWQEIAGRRIHLATTNSALYADRHNYCYEQS